MKLPNIPLVQKSLHLSEDVLPSELIELGLNDKQKDYLVGLKTYYLVKIGSLYAVLNGCSRSTFVRNYLEIEYTNLLDRYLEFELIKYELIKYSWQSIQPVFTPYNIYYPEAAMLQIYHFEAIHSFSQCLAVNSRIYPATIYREYNSLNSIINKIKRNERLTKQEKKLAAKSKNRYLANETKELAIHLYLVEQCETVWSKSADTSIKNRFMTYKQEKESIYSNVKKPFHPRFNHNPIGWVNGLPL